MRRAALLFFLTSTVACGGSPSPPIVTPPSDAVTISGTERIGWDQPAADAVELATIGYAIYVDGNRTVASGVACAAAPATAGFACTASLPPLTPGAHTLQIASFVTDGILLESTRSAALAVNVVRAATAEGQAGRSAKAFALRASSEERSATASAERSVQQVVDGFVDVTDIGFAPGGQLFVAEGAGQVTVIDPGARFQRARAGRPERPPLHEHVPLDVNGSLTEVLALAIDPQFLETHFVFAIYTEPDRDGAATFTLARFREAGGTFGGAAVLLDRIAASASPRAALRFGADGSLYAAFDAGRDPDRSNAPAAFSGKVLRLNPDGTTPRDQRSGTPIVAADLLAPSGLAWLRESRDLWIVDRRTDGSAQLREAGGSHRAFRLPQGFVPSSAAVTSGERNDLLIASAGSNVLLRVRFDPATAEPNSAGRVTVPAVDGIRAIAVGPDGAIYAATATAVWKLRAER